MFLTPLSQLTTLATVAVCLWAIASGRWPERVGGGVVLLDWLASAMFEDRRPHHHLQGAWFLFDTVQFIVLASVVVWSRRRWCLWACACGLLLLVSHATMMIDQAFGQWSYITVLYGWTMGIVLALALGMVWEGRRPERPFPLPSPLLRA